jgi:signal transduction histidine kinase
MKEKRAYQRSLTLSLRIIFPCLAATVGFLSAPALSPYNNLLFGLASQQGLPASPYSPASISVLLLMVLISFLSCEAAARVNTKFLPLVFVQVSAIAILLVVSSRAFIPSYPLLAAVLASSLSFALGLLTRQFKAAEVRETSRYFELTIKNDELLKTRLALLKQDEADRRILASDLHDQVLNEIKMIKSRMQKLDVERSEDLVAVERSLDLAAGHIRDVMESLFPSVLENLGLCPALDQLTRDTVQRAGIQGRFVRQIDDQLLERLGKVESLLLYRLVQESLNNVVKHAEAKTVRVMLEGQDNVLTVRVVDDGKGFSAAPGKDNSSSRGLRYMTLRADLIGADLSWEEQTRGTTVKITLIVAS